VTSARGNKVVYPAERFLRMLSECRRAENMHKTTKKTAQQHCKHAGISGMHKTRTRQHKKTGK
jgi:hypothetical protein